MTSSPTAWSAASDVPLTPIEGVTDERLLALAASAERHKAAVRELFGTGPFVEQALRYTDLSVQACQQAAPGPGAAGPGHN